MYLLILLKACSLCHLFNPLHPTMYLLIHTKEYGVIHTSSFTSHYVSINSPLWLPKQYYHHSLHPTMYLLIRFLSLRSVEPVSCFTSHYVSINSKKSKRCLNRQQSFTSHYVSINSLNKKPKGCYLYVFTSHYVSINSSLNPRLFDYMHPLHPTMYLLILNAPNKLTAKSNFTSHYVSINSCERVP